MRALITGGSKGIGRAVALRLARAGNEVLINYKSDVTAAEATAAEVNAAGGRARLVQADACSLDGISELAAQARSTLGELDLLVHCAVTAYGGSALAAPESDFRDSVFEKNGLSFLWLVERLRTSSIALPARSFSPVEARRGRAGLPPLGIAKALAEGIVRLPRRRRWRRMVCESTQCLQPRSMPQRCAQ